MDTVQWLSAEEAARRPGVKLGTLYSYVSRGVVRSYPLPEGKGSRFDRADLEGLLNRRRSQPGGGADLVVASRITKLSEDGVRFRGHLAEDLAVTHTFEEVASILWDVPHDPRPWPVIELPRLVDAPTASLSDHLRVAIACAAPLDVHRHDLRRESVVVSARSLIASAAAALPVTTGSDGRVASPLLVVGPRRVRGTVAALLASRLGAPRPTPTITRVVNTSLVLLADHEMATSTVAARVAASTRADVYSAVLAGAACGGPLHTGASREVGLLLHDAEQRGVAVAVGDYLRSGRRMPGFGHKVYAKDPRFKVLWDVLGSSDLPGRRVDLARQVLAFAADRIPVEPNVDFGGASVAFAAGMRVDAFEAVFLVARMAGLVAHTLEEYAEAPLRFRSRGLYVETD